MKGDVYRETSELTRQEDLFRLGNIKSRSDLEKVEKGEMVTSSLGGGDNEEGEVSESGSEIEEVEGVCDFLSKKILDPLERDSNCAHWLMEG